jgi:dipeptidyl aminopeptidase/acylaminoacyl peptidase
MRKIFSLLFVIVFGCIAFAQSGQKLLLKKEIFTDQASYPFLKRFTYTDSINVYLITYLSDGLKVNGFLVTPKKEGFYPVIIKNRGGNRDFGQWDIRQVYASCGQLAKEGYVVIASQYRGNDGSEGKEEFGGSDVNDVINLINVLPEIKEADTSRIGMYGWSRGGMMTYLALTRTNKIKAAVIGGGLSDLNATLIERPGMEKEYNELIPNYTTNKKEELDKRSAINWVDKFPKNVPILLLHGTSDWRVKPEQTLKMALEFEKYRIPYRLIMFEGGDHGITEYKDEVNSQVVGWFNRFLKNNESLPDMNYHGR